MNKKTHLISISLLAVAAILFACTQNKYASKSTIIELIETIKTTHSSKWCKYVNESESSITLKYSTMIQASSIVSNKPKSSIVVIKKSDLSPNELKLFQELNKQNSNENAARDASHP